MGCIFCDIAAGHREASLVYADGSCLAFMDIHPVSRGHVLVVPRRHAARLQALEDDERAVLFRAAGRVLDAAIRSGFARDGANLLLNDGAAAGQHVPHLHLHVVPRRRGDRFRIPWRLAQRALGRFGAARSVSSLESDAAALRQAMQGDAPA
ncbi:MAG: HIT family protein [Gammaproteobacteria bacterium]